MNGYHSIMNIRFQLRDRRCWRPAATVWAFFLLVGPLALVAQDVSVPQTPHPAAEEAIASLKSPYCPGFMLEVCTSSAGAALRDSLQDLAEEGKTADELINWVLENHGDTLLALPRAKGRGLVAWVIPPAAFLLGLTLVLVTLRVMKRNAGPEEEKSAELSTEEEVRLAGALKQLEEEEEPIF
jgi:cytochrome c-type biogenesis protein CcmH/NrfF